MAYYVLWFMPYMGINIGPSGFFITSGSAKSNFRQIRPPSETKFHLLLFFDADFRFGSFQTTTTTITTTTKATTTTTTTTSTDNRKSISENQPKQNQKFCPFSDFSFSQFQNEFFFLWSQFSKRPCKLLTRQPKQEGLRNHV